MPIFHRPELTNLRGKHCCYQWIVADRILYNRITSECLLLGNDSRMDSVKNKKKESLIFVEMKLNSLIPLFVNSEKDLLLYWTNF